ncbi:hypothetical protein QZQ97_07935 [Serratia sp. root2]|uniref:hypothetical protein n=1 Tax=Serratia sp. root2 TaxID=3059676 RepID=UPI00288C999C|nr:hypothetical protein [Serratia sp. root2]MDT3250867.1 hypothetical protein [Serratia sp. root2]
MDIRQYTELVKLIESSGFNPWAIAVMILLSGLIAYFCAFLSASQSEKGKMSAINENFEKLKKQLGENTKLTKRIETQFSERLWINQQVWLRKQEIYEDIFTQLDRISRHAKLEVSHYWTASHYNEGPDIQYGMSDAEANEIYKEWKKDQEAYNEHVNSEAFKNGKKESTELHKKSLKHLIEITFIKSVFLSSETQNAIESLVTAADRSYYDEDSWYDYVTTLDSTCQQVIGTVRKACSIELSINQPSETVNPTVTN